MIYNPHLDGSPFFWKAGPIGILLIHGFTATVAEVRPLAERLHAQGYSISAPLLPGHYTHPEELNRVKWQDWVASVEQAHVDLRSECDRVIVGGESTGGLLALYLAERHSEISALLLYAPALRLNFRPFDKIRLYLLSPFVRWIPKQNIDSNELWQGYPVNPLKGVIQLLKLQNQVDQLLTCIHQPALIIQGSLDNTVHSEVPDVIFDKISSNIKQKHWMQQSAHCVILDRELDLVTKITLDFIDLALQG